MSCEVQLRADRRSVKKTPYTPDTILYLKASSNAWQSFALS